jgi:hypothetical protein
MGVGLHAALAYGAVGLLLIAAVVGAIARRSRKVNQFGIWMVTIVGIVLAPIVTTGMLAHCARAWRSAGVETIPPNLPWYRLSGDANPADSQATAWHAWIGGGMVALLAVGWVAWPKIGRSLPGRRMTCAGAILGIVAVVILASGYGVARHWGLPHPTSSAPPPWGIGEWDDPAGGGDDLVVPLRVHVLVAGLSLSAGLAVIGLAVRARTPRRTIGITAACAMVAFASGAGVEVWLTTGWRAARFAALLRQPRDAAYLAAALLSASVVGLLLWGSRRGRRRVTTGSAIALGVVMAAQLWFAALILYDGSYRGSERWRFHKPFVQRVSP